MSFPVKNKTSLICKSDEKPCAKRFLIKKKWNSSIVSILAFQYGAGDKT